MRGDQLARQWQIIRANEASPNWLTVKEIAKREEAGIRTIYHDLEALQAAGFSLYTEKVRRASRLAFTDIFKLKITSFLSRKTARSLGPTPKHEERSGSAPSTPNPQQIE